MNRLFSMLVWLAPALLMLAGCHWNNRIYRPSGHHPSWDPVLGSCDMCGVCGGDCVGHTPASYSKHLMTCAVGCGEIYWGEWTSDPPDCCDPCDNCGNWIGPQGCCPPGFWQRLEDGLCCLWSYRLPEPCGPVGDVIYDSPAEYEIVEDYGYAPTPGPETILSEPGEPAEAESVETPPPLGPEQLAPPPGLSPPDEATLHRRGTRATRARPVVFPSYRRHR